LLEDKGKKPQDATGGRPPVALNKETIRQLFALSGREALEQVLEHDQGRELVPHLNRVDFFWLLKKIGLDDASPLLKAASTEQWQYLLDLELWERDRLDPQRVSAWLGRLRKADRERLVRWLFSEAQALSYWYFSRSIEVKTVTGDEVLDLPEGFFTFDNVHHIRILQKEYEEVIEDVLKEVARRDYALFQTFLASLAGLLPAEAEESMFRLRNMRLAEDGFLPHHEAVALYTHLKLDALRAEQTIYHVPPPGEEEPEDHAPAAPLSLVSGKGVFTAVTERIVDSVLRERLQFEFAGLCNQILAADLVTVEDHEILMRTCRKAAGYINVGLEGVSGGEISAAEECLKRNPLVSLFRVGFGMTLELKWETQKWLKEAWFARRGLGFEFWGHSRGGPLAGLVKKRPLFYRGFGEGEEFSPFKSLAEVEASGLVLHHAMALDKLLERLDSRYPITEGDWLPSPNRTFHVLIFRFWARLRLTLEPGFAPLSEEHLRRFFELLRVDADHPPHHMDSQRDGFIRDMTAQGVDLEPSRAGRLEQALRVLWHEFTEEYLWVPAAELDARFAKFF
jgi:hypothetical protein